MNKHEQSYVHFISEDGLGWSWTVSMSIQNEFRMNSSIPCPFHVHSMSKSRISTTAATQLGELLLRSWHWLCTWRPPWRPPWSPTGRFGARNHGITQCHHAVSQCLSGYWNGPGELCDLKLVLIVLFGISKSGYLVDFRKMLRLSWC